MLDFNYPTAENLANPTNSIAQKYIGGWLESYLVFEVGQLGCTICSISRATRGSTSATLVAALYLFCTLFSFLSLWFSQTTMERKQRPLQLTLHLNSPLDQKWRQSHQPSPCSIFSLWLGRLGQCLTSPHAVSILSTTRSQTTIVLNGPALQPRLLQIQWRGCIGWGFLG